MLCDFVNRYFFQPLTSSSGDIMVSTIEFLGTGGSNIYKIIVYSCAMRIAIAEKRFHKLKDNGHFHLRLSENGHPEDTFRENGLLRDTLCFLLFIKISIGLAEYKSHHEICQLRVRFYWRRAEWLELTGDPTCRQVRFNFAVPCIRIFFSLAFLNKF